MPQIFPAWMTSPFFIGFLILIGAIVALKLVRLLMTRNWRGLARTLGVLILVALIGYTLFMGWIKYLFSDFQWTMPPPEILVQSVDIRPFEDRIESVGTTQADESAALTSNVSETVKEILFEEGRFVTQGTVIARLHDDEQQANLIEATRAFERSQQLARTSAVSGARLDADRARLAVAQAQVKDREITAPFDGILGLRSLSVGDIVNPGTVITTLDDVSPIKLEFSIPESYLSVIEPGIAIDAVADAFPKTRFTGQIEAIDPRIDPISRAVRLKAIIQNDDQNLRAGLLMRVNIIRNVRQAPAISEEALVFSGNNKSVWIASAPDEAGLSTIENRPVEIGARKAGYVEITAGLVLGEKVVVDGVIKAAPGGKVKIKGEKKIEETIDTAIKSATEGKQKDLITPQDPSATATPAPVVHPAPAEGTAQ